MDKIVMYYFDGKGVTKDICGVCNISHFFNMIQSQYSSKLKDVATALCIHGSKWSLIPLNHNCTLSCADTDCVEDIVGFISDKRQAGILANVDLSVRSTLLGYGFNPCGQPYSQAEISFDYDKLRKSFCEGDVLSTITGEKYLLLNIVSYKKNYFLLRKVADGEYLLAKGVSFVRRTPKGFTTDSGSSVFGVEWSDAEYYGRNLMDVNLNRISALYADEPTSSYIFVAEDEGYVLRFEDTLEQVPGIGIKGKRKGKRTVKC